MFRSLNFGFFLSAVSSKNRNCFFYNLIYHSVLNLLQTNATWGVLFFSVDFGVSAQLDKTMGRRNTFIGTPYWLVLQHGLLL